MGKGKRKAAGSIRQPSVLADPRCIKFSLRFLHLDHPKFKLSECTVGFLHALLLEIVKYQSYTVDQFREWSPSSHRHPINFDRIPDIKGFPNVNPHEDEDMWTDEPIQFEIPGATNGAAWRVHGFLDKQTFYLVWLDPNHRLD